MPHLVRAESPVQLHPHSEFSVLQSHLDRCHRFRVADRRSDHQVAVVVAHVVGYELRNELLAFTGFRGALIGALAAAGVVYSEPADEQVVAGRSAQQVVTGLAIDLVRSATSKDDIVAFACEDLVLVGAAVDQIVTIS